MKKMIKALAGLIAFTATGFGALLYFRPKSRSTMILWIPKLIGNSLAPLIAAAGVVGAVLGVLVNAPATALAALVGSFLNTRYTRGVIAQHDSFERAFGPGWEERIAPQYRARLLRRRWNWVQPQLLGQPRVERDLPFWTIPGSDRDLLCDLWRPPAGIQPTGLAFLYFHGSAWHYLDKGYGSSSFFEHLAAQGHVVMDVAYRLCPETDLTGMVGDVHRAVAWMKQNGAQYGVNPERVVVGGGSAGGQIALLAAYSPADTRLKPADVTSDTRTRAVVSYYGITDMVRYHEDALHLLGTPEQCAQPAPVEDRFSASIKEMVGMDFRHMPTHEQMMKNVMGGSPEDAPEMYRLGSPVHQVHAQCPPTLLLQGEHDSITSAESVRELYARLNEVGVPVVLVEFPQTEHAFDVMLPLLSPAAQSALYDVDHFLALMI